MSSFEDYSYKCSDQQFKLMLAANQMLIHKYDLEFKLRYKIPFYYRKSWVCYLNPMPNDELEMCFIRANELPTFNLLQFKNRVQVAGLSLKSAADLYNPELNSLLLEAISLDQATKNKVKRP